MMALRQIARFNILRSLSGVRPMSDTAGSGAGKGGGSGGSVRDAGGAMGKRQAAVEEEYFRRQQAEQLSALKNSIKEEISYHHEQIEEHQDSIRRHKKKMEDLKKLEKKD